MDDGRLSTTQKDIIRDRENEFFRDLAAEKQGTKAHPLLHMIASHQKLNSIGVPLHQLTPNAFMRNTNMEAKKSPYEQPQILVEYMGRASTHAYKVKTANMNKPRQVSQRKRNSDGEETVVGGKNSSSATRHREFLSSSLNAVNEQLESTTISDISAQRMSDNSRVVSDNSKELRKTVQDGLHEHEQKCCDDCTRWITAFDIGSEDKK